MTDRRVVVRELDELVGQLMVLILYSITQSLIDQI